MTIYSDLWYKVIATPRYDKRLADSLRRAHNRAIQARRKSFGGHDSESVSRLENGRATAIRIDLK